jgi:uridylate kinase
MFRDVAHPVVYHKLDDGVKKIDHPLIIAAGAKPGFSSDFVATFYATKLHARRLVNLSNIDYVYTADPKKDPGAKKIEDIVWRDFRALIPKDWDPGLSSPFDPVAARTAEAYLLEVAIINGGNLDELRKYLRDEPFTGTKIHI